MEFFLFFKIAKKITPENEMLFAYMNFDNHDYGRNGFTSLPEGETCFLLHTTLLLVDMPASVSSANQSDQLVERPRCLEVFV